jgi:hypothetical protein
MFTRTLGLIIAAGLVVLLGLALFRPGSLFGVDGKALANSVGGKVKNSPATCAEGAGGVGWRCRIEGEDFSGVEYSVMMKKWGCWSATMVSQPAGFHLAAPSISGCVGITDLLGA